MNQKVIINAADDTYKTPAMIAVDRNFIDGEDSY